MARILVVDDESLIRVLVADVGESLGHEVLTAASIKEGQDLAQRGVGSCSQAIPAGTAPWSSRPTFSLTAAPAPTSTK